MTEHSTRISPSNNVMLQDQAGKQLNQPTTRKQVVRPDRMKMDRMSFFGKHGVFEEERKLGQRWYVDLDMQIDVQEAGLHDDLEQSINYALIYETVRAIMEEESFLLVEALAERIASVLLDTYSRIEEIVVRVTKPNPPFDIRFEGVTIEIVRARLEEGEGAV